MRNLADINELSLLPGQICWAELDPTIDREQGGRRPVVIVSSVQYLKVVTTLAYVVPVTTVDRGWPNHIRISALQRPSWALTEQLRTVSRSRIHGTLGFATGPEIADIRRWINRFLV